MDAAALRSTVQDLLPGEAEVGAGVHRPEAMGFTELRGTELEPDDEGRARTRAFLTSRL